LRAYHSYQVQDNIVTVAESRTRRYRIFHKLQSSIELRHRLASLDRPALVSESYAAPCVLAFAPPLFHPVAVAEPACDKLATPETGLFCFRQRSSDGIQAPRHWNLRRDEKAACMDYGIHPSCEKRCIIIDLIVHALPRSVGDAMCDRAPMKMDQRDTRQRARR
jgi:hypothetical protein